MQSFGRHDDGHPHLAAAPTRMRILLLLLYIIKALRKPSVDIAAPQQRRRQQINHMCYILYIGTVEETTTTRVRVCEQGRTGQVMHGDTVRSYTQWHVIILYTKRGSGVL